MDGFWMDGCWMDGCWMDGWMVGEAEIKPAQPSWSLGWAELVKNKCDIFLTSKLRRPKK